MKRKREEEEEECRSVKRRRKTAWVRSEKLTLANLSVIHDYLGPFCIDVDGHKAVPNCKKCHIFVKENTDMPEEVNKEIRGKGFEVDMLVKELFLRGGADKTTVTDSGIKFEQIKHFPWFATQVILFRSPKIKLCLDLVQASFNMDWQSSSTATIQLFSSSDIIRKLEDASLKNSIDPFCKKNKE